MGLTFLQNVRLYSTTMDEKRVIFYEVTLWTPQKHYFKCKYLSQKFKNVNGLRFNGKR